MRRSRIWMLFLGILCSAAALLAEPPPPPGADAIAPFVPAADLLKQVDFYVARMDEVLDKPESFDLAAKSRAQKDANTLAALALVLSLYDEDFPQKAAMPGVLQGAGRLADAGGDYQAASQALAQLKQALADESAAAATLKRDHVASLSVLMKQVPVIHARLTRGVDRRRLARQAEQTTGESATLAAIAQASIADASYAASPAEADEWRRHCVEMRDAASAVNAAVHAQDADGVSTAMKRLLVSCEACHATFRPQ